MWLDATELRAGVDLEQEIDEGLSQCRYGVVILSRYFFKKEWTRRELDGLKERGTAILPIWRDITQQDVALHSQELSSILGLDWATGTDEVASRLAERVGAPIDPRAQIIFIDRSHNQGTWKPPPGKVLSAAGELAGDSAWPIDDNLAAVLSADEHATASALILILPRYNLIEAETATAIGDWVGRGGGLLFLGFYFAPAHHHTHPEAVSNRASRVTGERCLFPRVRATTKRPRFSTRQRGRLYSPENRGDLE